ncbi:MAG: hypothetical protein Q9183_007482, partial [Haloplaca sp. 2 TL-2023]
FNNPSALSKYYTLLLSVVRVIAAVVLSRGDQNMQTLDAAKQFLAENRAIIVAVFKRQAGIGVGGSGSVGSRNLNGGVENEKVNVEELVELFVALMVMTGFVE